ncbi:hypothetical protein [Bacteroides sp. An322]|uniref:hypothetical protein n=1 Tax=Bacteroides sp. An322 TaxID=1965632 RepID=UPI000B3671C2|nr:hypothetical protein [Bacteroides sp. An322]OUO18585.1 hypothetical protein B5F91_09785 [Bacteroides sp. An322]
MRKKYLSALLFGALLFASAGTFTSCKDYDDDINNLSQRIDQVASDLSDLKTKVDALGGYVENVSFADGVLSVTTGGNTVTYNIPDKTGVNEVTLALEGNNLVLTVDGTATTIELPAGESGETPEIPEIEVIDGVLYINGEAQDLKVDVESNVTIIESTIPGNETYTVMVNGEEVTFAKAFADVRITLESANNGSDGFYFTEVGLLAAADNQQSYGIHWARATKDIAWDGPKGNIASGTLVVGQTTAAEVTVRPINFDLKAHENELTLVSSTGVVAPAKVVVYKSQDNGPLHSGSRAADITYDDVKQGDYVLGIQLNSDLTDRQVIESFATADGNHNVKYALALDGTVVTDYNFVIDTQLKADTQTKCEKPQPSKFVIGGENYWEAPTGTHQMTYLDGRIYDMKVEIDPSSQSDANVYGVKINEDGTITAGANAESRRFKLQVTLIDVNGNISETEVIEVVFKQADPAQITELAPMPYTVTPLADKSVVINLGDVFTSLSDEDAIALDSRNNIVWDIEDTDDTFVLTQTNLRALNGEIAGGITYYSDAACTQEIDANDWNDGEAVKSIKYAKIPVTNYNLFASLGEHLLSIKLYREVGVVPTDPVYKTIKTVNVPVDVQLPAWEALFSQPTQTWDNDTYITRIVDVRGTGTNRRAEISMDAYAAVAGSGAIADDIKVNYIGANIDGNMINAINGTSDNNPLMIAQQVNANFVLKAEASIADANGNLPAADMTADFQYTIGNVPAFTVKKENVKVHIKSIFEDVTYVWYNKDGNETTGPAELDGVTSTIKGTGSTDSDKKKGLALRFISQNIEIGDLDHATWGQFNVLGLLGGVQDLVAGAPTNRTQIGYEMEATSDGVSAITITKTAHVASPYAQSFITLTPTSGVISDNGGTITLTFTDFLGVKTEVVIPFVKKNL